MILNSTTLKLEAVLAGAVSANQPEVHVDYVTWNNENVAIKPQTVRTALNSASDVTILAAPTTTGFVLEPLRITIYNKDTASVTVTVKTDDGTTERIQIKAVLLTLEVLCWEKNQGWYSLDASGNRKEVTSSTFSSLTVTGAASFSGTTTFSGKLRGSSGVLIREVAIVNIHRELVGAVAVADNTATNLLTLTLSSVGGEDDSMSVDLDVHYYSAAGGTHSSVRGACKFAFTQDTGGNRVASTPTEYGETQALDAGMASIAMSFDSSVSTNVATLRVTVDDSANVGGTVVFHARVLGGIRGTSTCALAGGVTAGT